MSGSPARGRRRGARWRAALGVAAVLLLAADLAAQSLPQQFSVKRWTSEDGLPNNAQSAVTQDHDGFLWIGSESGLTRFDGRTFVNFSRATLPSLASNMVRSIFAASDGGLWVMSAGGLQRFADGRLATPIWTGDSSPSARGVRFAESPDGTLWILTPDAGIMQVRPGTDAAVPAKGFTGVPRGVAVDRHGTVWAATSTGLHRWVESGFALVVIDGVGTPDLIDIDIHTDELVLATAHALHWWTPGAGRARTWDQGPLIPGAEIAAMESDRSGAVWVSFDPAGFARVAAKSVTLIGADIATRRNSRPFEDSEGSIWLPTQQTGLFQFYDSQFTTFGPAEGVPTGVWAVRQMPGGEIWAGLTAAGVVRIANGQTSRVPGTDALAHDTILAMAPSRDGSAWVCGVSVVAHIRHGQARVWRQPFGPCIGLAIDDAGRVWAATRGGLWLVDPQRGPQPTPIAELAAPVSLMLLRTAPDGALWVLTQKGAVFVVRDGAAAPVSLPFDARLVSDIWFDHDGTVWFTDNERLTRWRDGQASKITLRAGIDRAVVEIQSLVADATGRLWLGTNHGIAVVERVALDAVTNGADGVVAARLLGRDEGMRNAECNGTTGSAAVRDDRGQLWFATVSGVVGLRPGALTDNLHLPKPRILETTFDRTPMRGTVASVGPGRGDLAFEFTGITFFAPQQVSFRYRLIGNDKEWIAAGTRRAAFYTNLWPATYRFEVQAANSSGRWNPVTVGTTVRVRPHVYQTAWFVGLCLLIVAAVSWRGHRWRFEGYLKRTAELEHAVSERTVALQKAVAARSEFVANMSHELRTPMNAVIGMATLLEDMPLADDARDCAETIRMSGETLLSVINDILDYSKIEAGALEVEARPLSLQTTVEEAIELAAPRVAGKPVQLFGWVDEDVPASVVGDVTRLRQVLTNLLSNAVKFTSTGEVRVTARRGDADDVICFDVRDTGIGIPAERLDRLFKSFSQVDASTTRQYGGTGLGLVISRRLAELMGGGISVASIQGEGSTFSATVRAPAAPGAAPAGCILLVDADVVVMSPDTAWRAHTCRQVERLGYRAHPAASCADIDRLMAMRPRVVVLDAACGELLQATTIARAADAQVVIAGAASPAALGDAASRIARIRKPVKLHTLAAVLRTAPTVTTTTVTITAAATVVASPTAAATTATTAAVAAPPTPTPTAAPTATATATATPTATIAPLGFALRVLVAEDNLVNQKVAAKLLQKLGCEAVIASDGAEAVEAVRSSTFDLVLMDMQMPGMDGLEATICIRQLLATQPRIVALTASTMPEDRQRCLDAGMNDWLTKPIQMAQLRAVLVDASAAAARAASHDDAPAAVVGA